MTKDCHLCSKEIVTKMIPGEDKEDPITQSYWLIVQKGNDETCEMVIIMCYECYVGIKRAIQEEIGIHTPNYMLQAKIGKEII